MEKDFEVVEHTADLKIRVFGTSRKELFRNALIGMFQSIGPKSSACTYQNNRIVCPQLPITRTINITAPTLDIVLVDFLSEALYFSDTYDEAYLDAAITKLTENDLEATVYGIHIEGFAVVEIKAVTFHDLHIKQVDTRWQTDIVFDI